METIEIIRKHVPCTQAATWATSAPDPETAWNTCERPDWMLWISARVGASAEAISGIARSFALNVVHLWEAPSVVLEYLRTGNPEIGQKAADAARAAANAAVYAAYWAANAAYCAADAAARATHWAANAAANAAYCAADAAADAAAERQKQCVLIRETLPWSAMKPLIGLE